MAITLVILVIQVVVVTIMFSQQTKQFKQDVFTQYTSRLQEIIGSNPRSDFSWSLENIEPALKMVADDRISGLILRDAQGNTVLTFGKTPHGIILPEPGRMPDGGDFQPLPDQSWFVSPSISKLYIGSGENAMVKQVVMPMYPEPVRKQDVVGTVTLYADKEQTEVFGYVDVLVFSPMTYSITAMLLQKMVAAFGITIPIALVIAFMGAHMIAGSVSRHAGKVIKVLEAVAGGDYQQEVPESTITELAQISESVERLEIQLASHERMRQQWLRSIAHDLNTPVTALKISVEGALDGVLPPDRETLERMKHETEELEHRVGAVLTLAAMEAPDFHMQVESIDVLDFADEVVNSSLADHQVNLDIDLERMAGDRRLLLLVCRELIKNACKYSVPNSVIRWRITKADPPASVRMEVSDHGVIDQEHLKLVFEPWFQADSSRSKGGSGLGLAIVRQVMEAHGGTVTLEQRGDSVVAILVW